MLRRLFRDSVIYAGASLTSTIFGLILFPFLAHRLQPRSFGLIDIVGLLTTIALLTVALEINEGLVLAIVRTEDSGDRSSYASTALWWSIASYTGFAAICLVFASPLSGALLGPHVNVWIMRAAVGRIWIGGALYVVQDQLRWHLRPRAYFVISAVTAAGSTAATAIYVFVLNAGALGVVAGQLTGVATGLVAGLALSRGLYRMRFDLAKARAMLAFSIPLVPSSAGVFLNNYADRLALQHQRSLAAVGLYGVAFRVATAATLMLVGIQGATIPHIAARHADPTTAPELARAFRFVWATGCVAFICLSMLAEPIVRLLSAPAYFGAAHVVPFLIAASFLAGLFAFAPGPTITGRTRLFAAINVIAGSVNLGLAFALVPSLGVTGAGIATVTSSLFLFTGIMAISQRLYHVPHRWRRLAAGTAAAVAIEAAGRTMIATDRSATLGISSLVERAGICVVGVAVVGAMLIDRGELRVITPRALAQRLRARSLGSAR